MGGLAGYGRGHLDRRMPWSCLAGAGDPPAPAASEVVSEFAFSSVASSATRSSFFMVARPSGGVASLGNPLMANLPPQGHPASVANPALAIPPAVAIPWSLQSSAESIPVPDTPVRIPFPNARVVGGSAVHA